MDTSVPAAPIPANRVCCPNLPERGFRYFGEDSAAEVRKRERLGDGCRHYAAGWLSAATCPADCPPEKGRDSQGCPSVPDRRGLAASTGIRWGRTAGKRMVQPGCPRIPAVGIVPLHNSVSQPLFFPHCSTHYIATNPSCQKVLCSRNQDRILFCSLSNSGIVLDRVVAKFSGDRRGRAGGFSCPSCCSRIGFVAYSAHSSP